MLSLKRYRTKAKGLADLLPYAALIEPDVVLCKDGSFLAAWEIRGQDVESVTDDEKGAISYRMSEAARRGIGSGWMLHVDAVRLPAGDYPAPEEKHFPDPVSRMLDDARRKTFSRQDRYYTTMTVLSVVFKAAVMDARLKKLSYAAEIAAETNFLEESLERFKEGLTVLADSLSIVVEMDRLGSRARYDEWGKRFIESSLLSFLQLCLIGEEYCPRIPHTPMYLDALVGGQDMIGGIQPEIGGRHIGVIGIDGLPSESFPAMLSMLSALPFASRFSTRYIGLDKFEALAEVDKYRKSWAQRIFRFFDKVFAKANPRTDQDAASMTRDAESAYASLQGDYFGAGFYTANLVLLDSSPDALQEKIRTVRRALLDRGFGCRHETVNALEAWLSTHPGNWVANVRRPLVSSLNLADFLPLSSVWSGLRFNPCPMFPEHSPALVQCVTQSSTPFWFNLHVGDLGHATVVGPTGSGKSTLLALLAAQFLGYRDARVWVFDKGMSMYALCRGVEGRHYNIGGDDSPAFAPLQSIASNTDMAWGAQWIENLCALQNVVVTPAHRAAIHEALHLILGAPARMRTLTGFAQLARNQQIKDGLQHYTRAGGMGMLLDAEEDGLTEACFTVFEIEQLMNMKDINALPVLTYLFHVIEKSLTGRPTLLILDEAWLLLSHPLFSEKIREWLKVLRKANCAVVFATQSLSDIRHSAIRDDLIESCPTKIFLANAQARSEEFVAMYKAFGLNDRQIELVADAVPKRHYYMTSPDGQRMVTLDLSPEELAFVGAGSKEAIARIKELGVRPGWQKDWLRERGISPEGLR